MKYYQSALLLAASSALATAAKYNNSTQILTGGSPFDENTRQAVFNPLVRNSYTFPGFNFTNITNPSILSTAFTLQSDELWTWNLNFTTFPVDDSGISVPAGEEALTSLTEYDFSFPEGQLPAEGESDFALCLKVMDGFPDHISTITPSDPSNSSCVPYLGQECYDAFVFELLNWQQSPVSGCVDTPFWGDIPACKEHLGQFDSAIITTSLMNVTNVPNDVPIPDPPTDFTNSTIGSGLTSYTPIAYETTDAYPSSSRDAIQKIQTGKLRMAMLTFGVTPQYYQRLSDARVGYFTLPNDVRLLCGRTDPNVTSVSGEEGTSSAASAGLARAAARTWLTVGVLGGVAAAMLV